MSRACMVALALVLGAPSAAALDVLEGRAEIRDLQLSLAGADGSALPLVARFGSSHAHARVDSNGPIGNADSEFFAPFEFSVERAAAVLATDRLFAFADAAGTVPGTEVSAAAWTSAYIVMPAGAALSFSATIHASYTCSVRCAGGIGVGMGNSTGLQNWGTYSNDRLAPSGLWEENVSWSITNTSGTESHAAGYVNVATVVVLWPTLPVPEPSGGALAAVGGLAIVWWQRRRLQTARL